jgi:hypothetical protein
MVYTFGIPLAFGAVLYYYRKEIDADQRLKEFGDGETEANPQFWIRKRFHELYGQFRPGTVPC